jgi:RNA polymerase sigma-70 factor (ECF subfamily)
MARSSTTGPYRQPSRTSGSAAGARQYCVHVGGETAARVTWEGFQERSGEAADGRSEAAAPRAAGLEQVYLINRDRLLRFLRARGAGDDADDLLQELWLKASSGVSGPVRDPLPYLFRVANNLMLDRRRRLLRQARRDHAWADLDAAPREQASELPSNERAAIARTELAAAEQALAEVGERTDSIFRRFRLDGANQREIAAEQGISLSAVEKHLQKAYRALIDLRRRLDEV